MQEKKKLLFFDIDGTLVGFDGKIPASTEQALAMARSAGHKAILCTGRSRCQIYDFLLDHGFDGIVAATGAYVEYEGAVICHRTLGKERVAALASYFERENIAYMLQASDCQIASPQSMEVVRSLFAEVQKRLKREDGEKIFEGTRLADDLSTDPGRYACAEKLIYYASPIGLDEVRTALAPQFDVTAASFEKPDETSGEVTQAGINKAFGMRLLAEHLNCRREDIIAFGDGPNDIDMLEFAGTGVAMGNAGAETKAAADLVTDRIGEDGIAHALYKLGIIERRI